MLAFILLILFTVPIALLRGYVLSIIWGWFLVPLGVPAIGVIHAIGIVYVTHFLVCYYQRPVPAPPGKPWWDHPLNGLVFTTLMSLITWGFAAIVHAFM